MNRIRVLIVEDDPMVAAINRKYLEKDGRIGHIRICKNGSDALQELRAASYDLVLLDVYMPEVNGLELLAQIRAAGNDADVILVTADNNSHSIATALRLGAIDYLVKPFEYRRFCRALDTFFLKKNLLLSGCETLTQGQADLLFRNQKKLPSESKPIQEKGIHPQTYNLVLNFLKSHAPYSFSGGYIAAQINLSRVTVHKYLNYMLAKGIICSEINYKTEGRPQTLYYMKETS